MGFLDDIINPAGAITGIDPVKDATGFTGTSFGPTKAQEQAKQAQASGQGAAQSSSAGGGGGGPPASSGQYIGQFQAQQNQPFAQFGQQLAQMAPQTKGIGNITSPSAQATAAAVTSSAIQAKQNPAQTPGFQPQQSFWLGV